jgi:hypothetical protein
MTKVVSKLLTQSKRFIKWVILTIVSLVIFCIGYSCLQWQLNSYKTSKAMVTLGLLHLKNKKRENCWSQQWDLACVSWYLALWESFEELGQKPQDHTVPVDVWVGTWFCEKAPRN